MAPQLTKYLISERECEELVKSGHVLLFIIFVQKNSKACERFFRHFLIFMAKHKILLPEFQVLCIDVEESERFALQHRVSITPTLIVVHEGLRKLTRICEIDEYFMHNWLNENFKIVRGLDGILS